MSLISPRNTSGVTQRNDLHSQSELDEDLILHIQTKRTIQLPRDDMTPLKVLVKQTHPTPDIFAHCSTTNAMVAVVTVMVILMSAHLLFPVSQSQLTSTLAHLLQREKSRCMG